MLEESLREKITRFFDSERFSIDRLDAISQYTDNPEILENEQERTNFYDWYIHDYILKSKDTTIIKLFAEEMKSILDDQESKTACLWSDSALRLYEVTDIKIGVGFFAKNVFDGVQLFVHDVSVSASLARHDILFTRLYQIGTITRIAASVSVIPHMMLKKIKQYILNEYGNSGCKALDEYFKKNSLSMFRYLGVLKNSDPIRMTPEGDIIGVSGAKYAVKDAMKIKKYFDRSPDLIYAGRLGKEYRYDIVEADRQDELAEQIDAVTYQSYYVSTKKGQPNLRVVANIGFDRKRLHIECMSEQRLAKSKRIVERLIGDLVRYEEDTYGMEQDHEGESADELDEKLAAKITAKFFDEYYRSWLKTNIASLGGQTPLEASKTVQGREFLSDIIKDMENIVEHNGWKDTPHIKKLKSRLGLD